MRKLVSFINSSVFLILLFSFMLVHLFPLGESSPMAPSGDSWIDTLCHKLDLFRFQVSHWSWIKIQVFYHSHTRELVSFGAILLGINAMNWIVMSILPQTRQNNISLKVNGGVVSITIRAVEESLTRALRGEPSIKDSKVLIRSEKTKIHVKACLTLIENTNLHLLEEKILDKLRSHFEAIFPSDKPVEYEAVIHKLRPSSHASMTTSIPVAEEKGKPDLEGARTHPPIEQPRYPDKEEN
jgi:hypothetical protein